MWHEPSSVKALNLLRIIFYNNWDNEFFLRDCFFIGAPCRSSRLYLLIDLRLTDPTAPSLHSSHVTSFHMDRVRRDWSQPRRTRSLQQRAQPSSPWSQRSQFRWSEVRWDHVTLLIITYFSRCSSVFCLCVSMATAPCISEREVMNINWNFTAPISASAVGVVRDHVIEFGGDAGSRAGHAQCPSCCT